MSVVVSKKLRRDHYVFYKKHVAGVVLAGWEVKSIRGGKANLKNAYCHFKGHELFLINMHVKCWMLEKCDETRERKLLLNKRELLKIKLDIERKSRILLPTTLFWQNNKLKVEISEVRKIKKSQKRSVIKELQLQKEHLKDIEEYF